jgi:septum formation protein
LGLSFNICTPALDETPLAGEAGRQAAARLACAKAQACAPTAGRALAVGADQVAVLDGEILGKPGTRQRATAQLNAASGRQMVFFTGICLLDPTNEREWQVVDETVVRFRALSAAEIDTYLEREQPYDCAGSFKAEGLGISLFDAIDSKDPTALIGLPLIALARFLRQAGVPVP